MEVEQLCEALEKVLSVCKDGGLSSVEPRELERLQELAEAAETLNLPTAKQLIQNLAESLKAFQEGRTGESSVGLRIEALEFYLNNFTSQESLEEI